MIDKDKLRKRHRSPELWLLQLQALTRLGPFSFGATTGLLTLAVLVLPLLALGYPFELVRDSLDGALFFSLSIAVLAGCTEPVFRGASADVAAMAGVVPLGSVELSQVQASVTRETLGERWLMTALGTVCALFHSWIMGLHTFEPLFAAINGFGTLLLWIAMFWTVPPLLNNAMIFRQLGTMADPDLLRPTRHAAFGRAALRPALFIIAMLCIYPLLAVGDAPRGPAFMGFAATLLCLFGLFFLPLAGIRRRIREVREATLAELDARADRVYPGNIASAGADQLFELDAILDIRERIVRASAWPLDLKGVQRILLYVILPPLTWAAAALLEMAMEQLL